MFSEKFSFIISLKRALTNNSLSEHLLEVFIYITKEVYDYMFVFS